MEEVVLAFGSNLGDRLLLLEKAYALVNDRCGSLTKVSKPIETRPLGFESNDLFLNSCAVITTDLSPIELLQELKRIEMELGRTENQSPGYSSRLIDIDIIFYGSIVLESDILIIPHPKFRERLFVLEPLASIMPDKKDPLTTLTVLELHEQLSKNSKE
jgi:2-amino-4-hydroxy-6-hydroxymethyldihydropteridine diphosphokinase